MMSKSAVLALSLGMSLVGVGCTTSNRHGITTTGDGGNNNNNNNNNGSDGGNNNNNGNSDAGGSGCSAAAQLVYVIDEDTTLYSFDPPNKKFTSIGNLNCGTFGDTPFSMGVDRDANAWVLYQSGNVYQVSTTNASCQSSTRQVGQGGLTNFGMGFASDTQGGTTDTLYVVGGDDSGGVDSTAPSTFATMSVPGMSATKVTTISGWPELTGNDNGELWGFFPSSSTPKVSNINKSTGAFGTTYNLSSLKGNPSAWAFAFYGGDYYVFLMKDSDNSTNVYKVSGTDGSESTWISNTGKTIVGAGVSTCAPVTIQ